MNTNCGVPIEYKARHPERTKLYKIVSEHINTFYYERELEGKTIPKYIREEFDSYLKCGIYAHGFVQVHCETCNKDLAVGL